MFTEYLNPSNIVLLILIISNLFTVFLYFRNPQENLEKKYISLDGKYKELEKEILDIKQTNIIAINKNVADLTSTVNKLEISVAKLSTIIDERIPKKQN